MPLGLYIHLPFCRVHCTYCPFAISHRHRLQDRVHRGAAARRSTRVRVGSASTASSSAAARRRGRRVENLRAHRCDDSASGSTIDDGRGVLDRGESRGCDCGAVACVARARRESHLASACSRFTMTSCAPLGRVHGRAQAHRGGAHRRRQRSAHEPRSDPRTAAADARSRFAETLETAIALGAGHRLALHARSRRRDAAAAAGRARTRRRCPTTISSPISTSRPSSDSRDAGLAQYEISNFARAGEECRHNLRYWRRERVPRLRHRRAFVHRRPRASRTRATSIATSTGSARRRDSREDARRRRSAARDDLPRAAPDRGHRL